MDLVPKICPQLSDKLCMSVLGEVKLSLPKQRSINVHSGIFLHEGFHQLSEVSKSTDIPLNDLFLSSAKQQFGSSMCNAKSDVSRRAFPFIHLENEVRVMQTSSFLLITV